MKTRLVWVFVGTFGAVATALATPAVLLELGLNEEHLLDLVGRPAEELTPLAVLSPLKSIPPPRRVDAVKTLSRWANDYVASGDFKKRYATARDAELPPRPAAARSGAALVQELEANYQTQVIEMRRNIQQLPHIQRRDAEERLKEMETQHRKAMADAATQTKTLDAAERQRFQMEQADYAARLAEVNTRFPADGRAWVRMVLERFILETHGVEHGARVHTEDGYTTFAKDVLEAKPQAWKACFRAGKPACEAARAEALAWIRRNPAK